jgi:hypothetical protein
MDDEATEPIRQATPLTDRVRQELTPSRIVAGVSTAVALVAVGALIWVVGHQPAESAAALDPGPAAVDSAPRVTAQPVAARPVAASPAPAAPQAVPAPEPSSALAPAANSTAAARNPMFSPIRPATKPPSAAPRPAAAPRPEAAPRPNFDFTPVRPENFWSPAQVPAGVDAQRTVDTVVGAVTGTAGWVGNGVVDILSAMIIANGNGNWAGGPQTPEAALGALLLPALTTGPGMPNSLPALDLSTLPPPNLDFMRNVPPPNLDFLRNIPPPNLDVTKIPPPNLDFLQSIPPPQMPPPPNLDFLRSIPPPRFPF